jgi:hypothetical protein
MAREDEPTVPFRPPEMVSIWQKTHGEKGGETKNDRGEDIGKEKGQRAKKGRTEQERDKEEYEMRHTVTSLNE